jgi:methylmalonyl-CoA epimerase
LRPSPDGGTLAPAVGWGDMKIKRIEHVAVAVKDMQASIGLLQDAFGLQLEYEETRGDITLAMLPVGETYIELLTGVNPASATGRMIPPQGEGLFHLCFEVEDIDEALAELKQKGVKLIDQTPRIGHGGCRIAFIDPSATGNMLIELAQLPEGH